MKYRYTMLLSPVIESNMLSFMEGNDNTKVIMRAEIKCESDLHEEDKKAELRNKIGTKTPDGMWEFVGYEDLARIID